MDAESRDVRDVLNEVLDANGGLANKLVETADKFLDLEKQRWAECPHCHKSVQVRVADEKAFVQAVKIYMELLNQAKGMPAQRTEVHVDVDVRHTLEQLDAMNDDELAAIAAR